MNMLPNRILILVLLLSAALVGCGKEPARMSPDAANAQLKAMADNPNTPAAQKETINAHLDQAKTMDELMPKDGK